MITNREPYLTIFKIFNILGFWNDLPKWHKMIATSLMILCTVGYALIITLSVFQVNEFINILDGINVTSIIVLVVISLCDFIRKKPKIREILELLEELKSENPEFKPYFEDAFKLIYNIFLTEAVFGVFLFISFFVTPLIMDKLMFRSYIPELIKDYQITFYVYWLFQSCSGLYCLCIYLPIHEFRCSLLLILNRYIEFFRDKLLNLRATKEKSQEAKDELIKCVKIHYQIKRFMDIYMEIFELPLFSLLFSGSIVMCMNAFVIATFGSNKFQDCIFPMMFEIFMIFTIFIPCFYAHTIQDQCDKFIYDLFSSDWLESDVQYKKLMVILMENLKKKVVFTISGFIEVNLLLFIEIIKFVYSMYCVLQTIKD